MTPCKRIEIVIEAALARRLAGCLDEAQAPGYTVIPRASGRGDRGQRRADEPTGTDTNCVFIIACEDQDAVSRIVEAVRPLLSRFGGVCLVSDTLSLRH